MIEGRRVLALITARGGSKGLPQKNVLPLAGRPLVSWTVQDALHSAYVDRVVISTDSPEIAAAAESAGCEVPFLRPPELAGDRAKSIDVALHALDEVGGSVDFLVLLQPTSPLRVPEDIDRCLEMALGAGQAGAVTVTEAVKPVQHYVTLGADQRVDWLLPADRGSTNRQDMGRPRMLNGAVYVAVPDSLRRHRSFVQPGTRGYEMPPERSVDIDTHWDMRVAEAFFPVLFPQGKPRSPCVLPNPLPHLRS